MSSLTEDNLKVIKQIFEVCCIKSKALSGSENKHDRLSVQDLLVALRLSLDLEISTHIPFITASLKS